LILRHNGTLAIVQEIAVSATYTGPAFNSVPTISFTIFGSELRLTAIGSSSETLSWAAEVRAVEVYADWNLPD